MKEDVIRGIKAKEQKEWSDDEIEKLIEFYKVNEQLLNHKLVSYKDRNLKELNYARLMELLPGLNQEEVKKEWAMLRTIFN